MEKMQTIKDFKYLSFTYFKNLVFWDYYSLSSKSQIKSDFELVELSQVLKHKKDFVLINDDVEYKRCRVQLYGKGIILRDKINGKEIKTKKQQLCKKDDFLVAEIDAKFGGYGIVPKELENAIVSGHYFLFEIDKKKLLPDFLSILVKCNGFSKQVKATGSTNYAAIRPYHVLSYLIPLPPLEEQNRIVKAHNKKIELAKELEEKAHQLDKDIEIYLFDELGINKKKETIINDGLNFISFKDTSVWGVEKLLKGTKSNILESNKFPNEILSQVTLINPTTDISHLKDEDEMSFIPMVCVSDNYGEIIKLYDGVKGNSKGYTKFKNGDLVWARITPCMQNGKSAVVDNLKNGLGYGSTEYHVLREKCKDVLINYVYHLLRSHAIRKDAISHFTGSAGQQRVPKSYLENLIVPVPHVEIQTKIISTITKMKSDIKDLNLEARKNREQAIKDFESEIFIND